MITFISLFSMILSLNSLKSLNPMKMILTLMWFSLSTFLISSMITKTIILPMIIFMLFIGGILVSFTVISSLMPNQKSLNMKFTHLMAYLSICVMIFTLHNPTPVSMSVKETLMSNMNMWSVTVIMVLYFFAMTQIVCQTKTSLRSMMCHKYKFL